MHGRTKLKILQPYLTKYPNRKLIETYSQNLIDPITHMFPLDPVQVECCKCIFERAVLGQLFFNTCPIHHQPTKYRDLYKNALIAMPTVFGAIIMNLSK